ncbi:TPA: hypothetical protein ACIAMN_004344, partial [Salmonella enterica subsp. enterica serovar Waycross]
IVVVLVIDIEVIVTFPPLEMIGLYPLTGEVKFILDMLSEEVRFELLFMIAGNVDSLTLRLMITHESVLSKITTAFSEELLPVTLFITKSRFNVPPGLPACAEPPSFIRPYKTLSTHPLIFPEHPPPVAKVIINLVITLLDDSALP